MQEQGNAPRPFFLQDPRMSFAVPDTLRPPKGALPLMVISPSLQEIAGPDADAVESWTFAPPEDVVCEVSQIRVALSGPLVREVRLCVDLLDGREPEEILYFANEYELAMIADSILVSDMNFGRPGSAYTPHIYTINLPTAIVLDDGMDVLGNALIAATRTIDGQDSADAQAASMIHIALRGWYVNKGLLIQPTMPRPVDARGEEVVQPTVDQMITPSRRASK